MKLEVRAAGGRGFQQRVSTERNQLRESLNCDAVQVHRADAGNQRTA